MSTRGKKQHAIASQHLTQQPHFKCFAIISRRTLNNLALPYSCLEICPCRLSNLSLFFLHLRKIDYCLPCYISTRYLWLGANWQLVCHKGPHHSEWHLTSWQGGQWQDTPFHTQMTTILPCQHREWTREPYHQVVVQSMTAGWKWCTIKSYTVIYVLGDPRKCQQWKAHQ